MKVLHLSDMHIRRGRDGTMARALLGAIADRYIDSPKPVVLVTGDVVNSGNFRSQYRLARDLFSVLVDRPDPFRVLMCPGNHDYGLVGNFADRDNLRLFAEYLGQSVAFPAVNAIDGCHLIGLDSMQEEAGFFDRFLAEGEVGDEQLRQLEGYLDFVRNNPGTRHDKVVVYLHHHPFDDERVHQLKDAANLLAAARNRVNALLFGHMHEERRWTEKEREYGIGLIFAAGRSTEPLERTEGTTFRFTEIDLSATPPVVRPVHIEIGNEVPEAKLVSTL